MDIQDQIRLEEELYSTGVERYTAGVDKAVEQAREQDTGYGTRILDHLLVPISSGLAEFIAGSAAAKHGKYRKLLKGADPHVLAFIGLKTLLSSLSTPSPATRVCMQIGKNIEDELRFAAFKEFSPDYFASLMRDFSSKNTRSYRHMRNVLSVTSNKKGFVWKAWSKDIQLGIGAAILEQVRQHSDLLRVTRERLRATKTALVIHPSDEAAEWIASYNAYTSGLHPYTKPCVVPPDDWTSIDAGGYWSERMRMRTPLIKGLNTEQTEVVRTHDMPEVLTAVNTLQRTAWKINTRVLDTVQAVWSSSNPVGLPNKDPIEVPRFKVDIPPADMDTQTLSEFNEWKAEARRLYTEEASRRGKAFEVSRVLSMAQSYREHEKLWFVYQCDFRGRTYASSAGVNPQGSDFNRALLTFSEGKPLGQNGMFWLAVHGANTYGVDKVSFDDRVDWAMQNIDAIHATAADPVGSKEFWGNADKPYMFLAFCLEFSQAVDNPQDFISHLPVGMDGSCNGLQNLSALLRDSVGGAATNLTSQDVPADIYQEVADKCLENLHSTKYEDSKAWLSFAKKHGGINRKLTKRAVMTLPYGCTKYSCVQFVYDALMEIDPTFFEYPNRAAGAFADVLWKSMGEVVVAAREAMSWLQKVATVTAHKNLPVWWTNPVGFPVYQVRYKSTRLKVKTCLMGGAQLSLRKERKTLDPSKQEYGIAPNFVHSLDSAHMMLVVNASIDYGITSFSVIHDDFGTHASDVDKFRDIIRQAFVYMYKEFAPLQDLYVSLLSLLEEDTIPYLPKEGDLNIEEVLESEYFFS